VREKGVIKREKLYNIAGRLSKGSSLIRPPSTFSPMEKGILLIIIRSVYKI
jgi:hypothetical protein